MDPRENPYAPGAGTRPPELAGRDELLQQAEIALDRIRNGLADKSLLLVGLRGVGKTVLLNRIAQDAETRGFTVVAHEAPENLRLPDMLAAPLHRALIKMRARSRARKIKRALGVLGAFVKAAKVRANGVEFSMEFGAEPGLADSGDLESDLGDLLCSIGGAARQQKSALLLCLDELQHVAKAELGALIAALHKCAQRALPVVLVGAGLPQLPERCGEAKSYAERLFSFPQIGALERDAAARALQVPVQRLGVAYKKSALKEVVEITEGYPYFIQEWGKHCWNCAAKREITRADVRLAGENARLELDSGFFRVRLERLTKAEKRYMRAMAELGDGPYRSGAVAEAMGVRGQSLSPVRSQLIKKGMIYGASHGYTAFTVPMFGDYLRRASAGWELN